MQVVYGIKKKRGEWGVGIFKQEVAQQSSAQPKQKVAVTVRKMLQTITLYPGSCLAHVWGPCPNIPLRSN